MSCSYMKSESTSMNSLGIGLNDDLNFSISWDIFGCLDPSRIIIPMVILPKFYTG